MLYQGYLSDEPEGWRDDLRQERRRLSRKISEIECAYKKNIDGLMKTKLGFYNSTLPKVWIDDTGVHHEYVFTDEQKQSIARLDECIAQQVALCREDTRVLYDHLELNGRRAILLRHKSVE
jgi:hypothetical protein